MPSWSYDTRDFPCQCVHTKRSGDVGTAVQTYARRVGAHCGNVRAQGIHSSAHSHEPCRSVQVLARQAFHCIYVLGISKRHTKHKCSYKYIFQFHNCFLLFLYDFIALLVLTTSAAKRTASTAATERASATASAAKRTASH